MGKERRKQVEGGSRELKKLQSLINYDCRKKSNKNDGDLRKFVEMLGK